MMRLVTALVASVGVTAATPLGVAADIGLTQTNQAILSCNDDHSVVLWVDSTALTSLAAEVESVNTSGTGLSCMLNTTTADPSTQSTEWTLYDYNPSDNAIAPRKSPNSMPATTSGNTTTFPFLAGKFTALLTTTDPSLTGDLSAKTLGDDISLTGPASTFMTQKGGGGCGTTNVPAAVRFYFISPSASGSTVGTPPAGFYTQFWWSNPVNMELPPFGPPSSTITAHVGDPTEWSDWNGQRPNPVINPTVYEAFEKAIQNVQTVGLSFGGECFFETGVVAEYSAAPPPYEVFFSTFTE
jgi:hypothetical protein